MNLLKTIFTPKIYKREKFIDKLAQKCEAILAEADYFKKINLDSSSSSKTILSLQKEYRLLICHNFILRAVLDLHPFFYNEINSYLFPSAPKYLEEFDGLIKDSLVTKKIRDEFLKREIDLMYENGNFSVHKIIFLNISPGQEFLDKYSKTINLQNYLSFIKSFPDNKLINDFKSKLDKVKLTILTEIFFLKN